MDVFRGKSNGPFARRPSPGTEAHHQVARVRVHPIRQPEPTLAQQLTCQCHDQALPVRASALLNESLDVVERQIAGPANR